MKSIGVCLEGLEKVVAKDLKGKKVAKGRVEFEIVKKELKGVDLVYNLISKFKFKDMDDLLLKISKIDFKIAKSVKAECNRVGEHDFRSVDVSKEVGKILFEKGLKVELKKPSKILYIDIIDDKCFVGELVFSDLCKRKYRVRISNKSINACFAYCLIKLAGVKKTDKLLDPFCNDGIIVIEAALSGCTNVYGYDGNRNNVKNAKINAELAEVSIEFGNYDLSWMTTRFGAKGLDKIVTVVPGYSKKVNKNMIDRVVKEFFEKAKVVLKGKMCLVSLKADLIEKHAKDFKIIEKFKVRKGESVWYVFVLK